LTASYEPEKEAVSACLPRSGQSYKGLAVASMVLGILSLVSLCFGVPVGIVAVVLSVVAKNGMRKSENYDGKEMATVGMVTGIIGIVVGAVPILIFLLVHAWPSVKSWFMNDLDNLQNDATNVQQWSPRFWTW